MKSPFALNTGIAAVVLSGLLLAGCGQTGPLYLPKPPAKAAPKANPAPPSAPADAADPVATPAPETTE